MIHKENIMADMHTHSIASLHAYSTIKENMDEAESIGLKYVVNTDHFYGYQDIILGNNEYFKTISSESYINVDSDVQFIGGIELNLFQRNKYIEMMKDKVRWRAIGMHSWFMDIPQTTIENVFKEFERAIRSGEANAVVHIERTLDELSNVVSSMYPDSKMMEFIEAMLKLCKETDTPIELNEHSLLYNNGGQSDRAKEWIKRAKKNENIIYLGTDAHYYKAVGKFDNCINLLNEVEYPKELILNCNEKLFKEYMNLD